MAKRVLNHDEEPNNRVSSKKKIHGHKIFDPKIERFLRKQFLFRNFWNKTNWTFSKFQIKYQIMVMEQLVTKIILKR